MPKFVDAPPEANPKFIDALERQPNSKFVDTEESSYLPEIIGVGVPLAAAAGLYMTGVGAVPATGIMLASGILGEGGRELAQGRKVSELNPYAMGAEGLLSLPFLGGKPGTTVGRAIIKEGIRGLGYGAISDPVRAGAERLYGNDVPLWDPERMAIAAGGGLLIGSAIGGATRSKTLQRGVRWLGRKLGYEPRAMPQAAVEELPPAAAGQGEQLPFELKMQEGTLPGGPMAEGVPLGPERLPEVPGGSQRPLLDAQGQPIGMPARPGRVLPPDPLDRVTGGVFDQPEIAIPGPVGAGSLEVDVFSYARPGQRYKTVMRVADLDELQVDHPGVQSRMDVGQVAARQRVVERIANRPSIEEYMEGVRLMDHGPAIVGADDIVESGNTRILGLRLARTINPEGYAKFQADQAAEAAKWGITPEELAQKRNPVLVRERVTPVENRMAFADEANAGAALRMSVGETAERDAQLLPDSMLDAFDVGATQTVDAAILSPKNSGAVQTFLNTMTPAERGGMIQASGRGLTPAGVARIKAALLAKMFRGETGKALSQVLLETGDIGVKNVETAIFRAMPRYLKAREILEANPQLDLSDDIAAAAGALAAARGQSHSLVQNVLATEDMFQSPTVRALLKHFSEAKSAKQITALDNYVDELSRIPVVRKEQGGFDIPGFEPSRPPLSKEELLVRAFEGKPPQGDLLPFETGAKPLGEKGSVSFLGDIGYAATHPFKAMNWIRDRVTQMRAAEIEDVLLKKRQQRMAGAKIPSVNKMTASKVPGSAPGYGIGENLQAPGWGRDPSEFAPSVVGALDTAEGLEGFQTAIGRKNADLVDQARRGVMSDPLVRVKAAAVAQGIKRSLGIDPTKTWALRQSGEALNVEGMLGLAMAADEASQDMMLAAARATREGRSIGDDPNFVVAFTKWRGLLAQDAGAAAEAGRALRIRQEIMRQRGSAREAMEAMIKEQGLSKDVLAEIQRVAINLDPTDTAAINTFFQNASKATAGDMVRELYINLGLLSGLKSLIVQIPSQGSAIAAEYAVRGATAPVDYLRAKITGTPQERFRGEATEALLGAVKGLKTAFGHGVKTFITEIPDPKFGGTQGPGFESRGRPRQAIPAKYGGRFVRLPGRGFSAVDDFLLNSEYASQVNGRLYRLARQRGIPEEEIPRFIDKSMREMPNAIFSRRGQDQVFKQIHEESILEARRINAKREPGQFTKDINRLKMHLGPLGWIIAPFTNTPSNLMHMGYRLLRSPLTLAQLMVEGSARGGQWSEDVARAVLGTAFLGSVAAAYEAGIITDGGPRDPRARDVRRKEQWEPYSVRSGNQWISYQRLDPAAIAVGVITDGLANYHTTDPVSFASGVLGLLGNNFLQKTYALNIENFSKFIDDPDRYGTTWASKTIGPFLVPSFVNQMARGQDPYIRRPTTIGQSIGMRLPTTPPLRQLFERLSQAVGYPVDMDIPPVRDVFGEPIDIVGSTIERMTNPFPRVPIQDTDPAYAELRKVGYIPQGAANTLGIRMKGLAGKVELLPKEKDMYETIGGRMAKARIEKLMANPVYNALETHQKKYVVQDAFRKAHQAAADVVLSQIRNRALKEGRIKELRVSGGLPF